MLGVRTKSYPVTAAFPPYPPWAPPPQMPLDGPAAPATVPFAVIMQPEAMLKDWQVMATVLATAKEVTCKDTPAAWITRAPGTIIAAPVITVLPEEEIFKLLVSTAAFTLTVLPTREVFPETASRPLICTVADGDPRTTSWPVTFTTPTT